MTKKKNKTAQMQVPLNINDFSLRPTFDSAGLHITIHHFNHNIAKFTLPQIVFGNWLSSSYAQKNNFVYSNLGLSANGKEASVLQALLKAVVVMGLIPA